MSVKEKLKIKCPECGREDVFDVWQLINVTKSPSLKAEIFNQSIFRFSCCGCNKNMVILYPLIYHDESKKLFIYFNPSGDFSNVIEEPGYVIKCCSDYSDFLEIIKILDDGINEKKVIEAKNKLLSQFKANEKLSMIDKIYYAGCEDGKISFYVLKIKGKISINL